ncbi:unnamed protein product [Clavelina lepadiformis]|uniref:Death domain-containing protein n=1 Tax=Clavelina lepadiformis TaxID=159417 RepID=A0ABP0FJH1_CLALP
MPDLLGKWLRGILEVKRFINWKKFAEDLEIDDRLLDAEEKGTKIIEQHLELLYMYHDRFGFSSEVQTKLKNKLHSQPLRDIPNDMQKELKTKIKGFFSNLEPTNAIDAGSCSSVHSDNMQKSNVFNGKRKTLTAQASGSRKKQRMSGFRFPFTLIPMKNNISRCEGCKAFFADQPSKDGKVIQHWETRKFKNENGELDKNMGNAYYHNNLKCVQRKHKKFTMKHLNSHD